MILFFIALFAAGLFWFQKFLYRRFWAEGIRVEVSFQEAMVQAGELEIIKAAPEDCPSHSRRILRKR